MKWCEPSKSFWKENLDIKCDKVFNNLELVNIIWGKSSITFTLKYHQFNSVATATIYMNQCFAQFENTEMYSKILFLLYKCTEQIGC